MKPEDFFKMAVINLASTSEKLIGYAAWLEERECNLFARRVYEKLLDIYENSKAHRQFVEERLTGLGDSNLPNINYLEFFEEKEGFSPCITRVIYSPNNGGVRGNLQQVRGFPFRTEVNPQILPDIPQPVIYGDELVVPYTDDTGMFNRFIFLDVHTGKEKWQWTPGGGLTFSSTPLPFHGFIYSVNNDGVKIKEIGGDYEDSYGDLSVRPEKFLLPLLVRYKKEVEVSRGRKEVEVCYLVVPSLKRISVLELPHCKEKKTLEIVEDNRDHIVGIECGEKWVIITTRMGKIMALNLEELSIHDVRGLEDISVASPPWKSNDYIYFEYMKNDRTRVVGAVKIPPTGGDILRLAILNNENGCIESDTHWDYPLVPAYQDRINNQDWILIQSHLFTGQTGYIHKIRRAGNNLVVAPQRLLQQGGLQLFNAGVYRDFLVYGEGTGVYSIDLRSGDNVDNLRLNGDVIAGPVFYQNRLFFVTTQGVECLEIG